MKNLLLEENPRLQESGVYIAYLILERLGTQERLSIFDLYQFLRKKIDNVNYANTMDALTFLKMVNLIDFRAPYFVRVK